MCTEAKLLDPNASGLGSGFACSPFMQCLNRSAAVVHDLIVTRCSIVTAAGPHPVTLARYRFPPPLEHLASACKWSWDGNGPCDVRILFVIRGMCP